MKRLVYIAASIIVCSAGWLLYSRTSASKPNIVLVVIDTLRADKLGLYGHPSPASRELDTLAKQGVFFQRAISQASWTRSSMASLLTGRYPRRIPLLKEKWDKLPLDELSLAETLQEVGYTTVGLTANPQLNRDFNFEQGFTEYVESSVTFGWMKKSPGKKKARGKIRVKSAPEMLERATEIVDVLYDGTAPLYLQLLLMDVHAHHRIEEDEIDEDLRAYPDRQYLQAVRNATAPLADFIKSMKQKLGENTIFIVTSDHGEGLRDHPSVSGSNRHGNLLYGSHVHVPLLFLGDQDLVGVHGARAQLVELIDVYPTLASVAGARVPKILDGQSLISIIRDPKEERIDSVGFSETRWRKRVAKQVVTDGRWMYIESEDDWKGTSPKELQTFGALQDGASTNVLTDYPEQAKRLEGLLKQIRNMLL
jgi:arylsulfatase A-like enzyme